MGQYHIIYNKTKKEYFRIGGAKLLEKSFDPLCSTGLMLLLANSNGRGGGDVYVERDYPKNFNPKNFKPLPLKGKKLAMFEALNEVSGRWAGDAIVIQGDYAKESDPGFIPEDEQEEYTDITNKVLNALVVNEELKELIQKDVFIKYKPEF